MKRLLSSRRQNGPGCYTENMKQRKNAGVVVKHAFDGSTYYQVREIVTPQGHWIEWPGIYSTAEAAYAAIRQENQS